MIRIPYWRRRGGVGQKTRSSVRRLRVFDQPPRRADTKGRVHLFESARHPSSAEEGTGLFQIFQVLDMKLALVTFLYVLFTTSAFAQLTARNPVDELKDEMTQALQNAQVPFSTDQERQLALLIEEERQAAENLFGVTWDFSNGPPQGEQRDQALAGIKWMYEELKKKLPAYMTGAQKAAWEKHEGRMTSDGPATEAPEPRGSSKGKIQQIRVTNNAFNVETGTTSGGGGPAGGGAKTEVIERGGAGAFHGNFASTFQDESLNARNPFAINKPPYYERTIDGNISGPVVRDRLSLNLAVSDNKRENVGTVKAETLDGPFSLGVTRPVLNRLYDLKGVLQLADAHSMNLGFQYATEDSKNENVGDFALPTRASRTRTHDYMADVREVSILSERTVHDIHFKWHQDHSERNPISNTLAIIVKDAFTSGGAQNLNRIDGNTFEFSNLVYYAGDKWTMRTGIQSWHRRLTSYSQENFFGEFTFSDLASYRLGKPIKYRITCCEPAFEMSQIQLGVFSQNDFKLTNRFTVMLGLRYQVQTNIHDRDDIDPRVGFAYAIGNATVVRGGAGFFSEYVEDDAIHPYLELDGNRRYEIQIDNPGWPDPFTAGTVRPRSRRILDPTAQGQHHLSSQVTFERSLPRNLFVTVSYDINRGLNLVRTRDINAPLPGATSRPIPDQGQIIQLQYTGLSLHHHLKTTMRQRFSIFNVSASYTYYHGFNDNAVGDRSSGTPALPTNSYNLRQDWGPAGSGPHSFNASVNSRLPMDVYLTTNIVGRSGNYYTITTGKDDNKDGAINDRPLGVRKNSELAPHFFNVSFNLSKAFELRRGSTAAGAAPQMNIFANLNNAFNMTHPGTPSGVMTSPFFGRSFNATFPREIEVGMRFQF
jgi:hypothetical protein